jgi:hypothetical protein
VEAGLTLKARCVYNERRGRKHRCAFHFPEPTALQTRALVRMLFSPAEEWARAHAPHTRSSVVMAWQFVRGILQSLRGDTHHRRTGPRAAALARWRCVHGGGARTLWLRDRSERGLGLLVFGAPLPVNGPVPILGPGQPVRWARVVHQTRRFPGVYRVGLEFAPEHTQEQRPHVYLAA